jgi:single-stranded DNA-binding protein
MQRNRIEAAGYLVSKPELRYLPSGKKVANVKMGESHSYMDSSGSMETQTNWHSLCFL